MSANLSLPLDRHANQLLAALPAAEMERLPGRLVAVDLARGEVLCESGSTPRSLIFPTTAIVSLSSLTEDGASNEFAVVGNEGVVGIGLFLGGDGAPGRAVVQSAGQGLRLNGPALGESIRRSPPLLGLLLRYAQSLLVQMAQMAVCIRHHTIEQRLSRRLLMGLDRSPANELALTQEAAANLLGVRREGVTAAALRLQRAGLIRYRRGRIQVLDRPRLEQRSCECYAVARREYQRLMPQPLSLAA